MAVLAVHIYTVFITLCHIACDDDMSNGLFWEKSRLNSTVTQPCSRLHPNFRFGVSIKRQCHNNGSWSAVDLSNCTMYRNSHPVVVVDFTLGTINLDIVNLSDITTKVSLTTIYLALSSYHSSTKNVENSLDFNYFNPKIL